MKFGQVRLDHAEGAVLVHSLRTNNRTFRKGHVLMKRCLFVSGGIRVRRHTSNGDIPEDEAHASQRNIYDGSTTLGAAGTGRVNIYAGVRGVFTVDSSSVDRINLVTKRLLFRPSHLLADGTGPTDRYR